MNKFGTIFQVSIFGASHDSCVGVLLDGIKPGLKLDSSDFVSDLERRKPQKFGTPRKEADEIKIMSGVFNGYTTGAPILLVSENNNVKSKDYSNLTHHFRPSHTDLVGKLKYKGFNDYRGGGTFSGRLTLGLVCASVVAKKIKQYDVSSEIVSLKGETDKTKFSSILATAKNNNDSVGGIIKLTIKNVDKCLGEPFFDSFESSLSHLLFSVPAVKGVSFGEGFNGTSLYGSEYNDLIVDENGKTKTNHDGGINGGITNGNDIICYVAIKPTPSISKPQDTFDFKDNEIKTLEINGRHDCAIILRALVVVEACANIVLTDLYLRNKLYE